LTGHQHFPKTKTFRKIAYADFGDGSQLSHILAGQECPAYRVNCSFRSVRKSSKPFPEIARSRYSWKSAYNLPPEPPDVKPNSLLTLFRSRDIIFRN
jgi:hypothetical protein